MLLLHFYRGMTLALAVFLGSHSRIYSQQPVVNEMVYARQTCRIREQCTFKTE